MSASGNENHSDPTNSPSPALDKSESIILGIDTSSHHGSLALVKGKRALALFGADSRDTQSTRLITEIDMILSRTSLKLNDLSAFAVITGPGSFTGLRIGISTVKGLRRAVNKPIVAVTALEAVAHAAAAPMVLSFVNALRGEIYAQLFHVSDGDGPVAISSAIVASAQAVLEQFIDQKDLVLAGDGIATYRNVIDAFAAARGISLNESRICGSHGRSTNELARTWTIASCMPFLAMNAAQLAADRFVRGQLCDPQQLDAFYVRQSDAELKLGQTVKTNL